MATKLPPIPSPPGTAFREFRINVMPALVFGAVLAATAYVWRGYVGPSTWVGEAESSRAIVSCPQSGRVMQLKVGPLQKVSAGEPLVQILTTDPRILEAQLALSKARIDFVRFTVDPQLRKENNRITYQKLRLDWMRERANLSMAKARLIYTESEYERARRLYVQETPAPAASATSASAPPVEVVVQRLISAAEYEKSLADLNSNRAEVEELTRLVADMELAVRDIEPEEAKSEEDQPNAVRAAVMVEERQLGLIEAQLAPITLSAPIDGFVSVVHRRAGEAVAPGDPIVTISQGNSERIVAFVRQPLMMEIATNKLIEVRSRGSAKASGIGQVLAVGSQLEPIHSHLLPARGQGGNNSEYGLPILVSIPPGMRLFGGEVVDLRPVE
jgi:multidrug resistance efflux pump